MNLKTQSKKALLEIAAHNGLDLFEDLSKDEIIEELEALGEGLKVKEEKPKEKPKEEPKEEKPKPAGKMPKGLAPFRKFRCKSLGESKEKRGDFQVPYARDRFGDVESYICLQKTEDLGIAKIHQEQADLLNSQAANSKVIFIKE